MVQPSEGESHALSLGEAALLAKTLVMSDLAVFTEQGWRHGHNCLMQPIGNAALLATNIAYMLDHEDERRNQEPSRRPRPGLRPIPAASSRAGHDPGERGGNREMGERARRPWDRRGE